jgi:hypothetical protein
LIATPIFALIFAIFFAAIFAIIFTLDIAALLPAAAIASFLFAGAPAFAGQLSFRAGLPRFHCQFASFRLSAGQPPLSLSLIFSPPLFRLFTFSPFSPFSITPLPPLRQRCYAIFLSLPEKSFSIFSFG